MRTTYIWTIAIVSMLSGCAADTTGITTSAVAPNTGSGIAKTAKVDPVCVALMSKIDGIRREGVADRVEKAAASGKSATLKVKRASLQQMAELDKTNAEFQAKCSTIMPAASAQAATAAPAAPVAAAAIGTAAATVAQ